MKICPTCSQRFPDEPKVEACPHCAAPLPPTARESIAAPGFEYRSVAEIRGWPLVHIAFGADPETGHRRVARGILAIGDQAVGLVAFGAMARGGVVFGAVGIGVISFSAVSLGVFSLGGLAVGLACAVGGLAIAPLAAGGLAIGYLAVDGMAIGIHAVGGEARHLTDASFLQAWLQPLAIGFALLLPLIVVVPIMARQRGERFFYRQNPAPPASPTAPEEREDLR